jgi:ribosomal protein S18 acetylase RimI-like enzyme
MMSYMIAAIQDKETIRRHLLTDRAYTAYALGDLEPPYNASAAWYAATRQGQIEALALVYSGLEPPALFLMGDGAALDALLQCDDLPGRALYNVKPGGESVLQAHYEVEHRSEMLRMMVTVDAFTDPAAGQTVTPARLTRDDAGAMARLLAEAASHDGRDPDDIAFTPDMVDKGPYAGIYEGGVLIAMAGTHLVAPGAGLATLGNVVVRPGCRGRGLGTVVSQAVTERLLADGYDPIVLNVHRSNQPAIRIYERLGYRTACTFVEGMATRREYRNLNTRPC